MRRMLPVITTLLLMAGCGYAPPVVDAALVARASAAFPGTNQAQLEQARATYLTACTACHVVRDPSRYSAKELDSYLAIMGERAHLDAATQESVRRYLQAARTK